jgi:hypothetical protein
MTNLAPRPEASLSTDCPATAQQPVAQRIEASSATLGEGMQIRRALPTRHRRMVGPWCFLDHFGPADVAQGRGMRVGPHPHCGLQTVTWLFAGEILHRDSLGSVQTIVPGQLNLMTGGAGISHSEESPAQHSPLLHGLQFWLALPESARHGPAAFHHYPNLPLVDRDGVRVTVLAGEFSGAQSPAQTHSPIAGLDVLLPTGAGTRLPLRREFEYAAVVTEGAAWVGGEELKPGTLLYLGRGRSEIELAAKPNARVILVGGEPFGEEVLMWWNFVARTRAEITQACREWNSSAARFGEVSGYDGARLAAPLPPWAALS